MFISLFYNLFALLEAVSAAVKAELSGKNANALYGIRHC